MNSERRVHSPICPVCPIPRESRRPNHAGGFTLVELVAVLVLVGILSLTATPVLTSLPATRQAAATSQVLRDLQFARQTAVARGVRTWVLFDVSGDTCSVMIEDASNPGRAGRMPIVDQVTGKDYVTEVAQGVFMGGGIVNVSINGEAEVGFDFLGRSIASDENVLQSDGTVELVGGHRISITARTGFCFDSSP